MGVPHCRSCNSWHYEVPVNLCPGMEKGFVRPVEAVNPYIGTVLEKWFRPIKHTVEQRRAWAELAGREYVEPKVARKTVTLSVTGRNAVTPIVTPTVTLEESTVTLTEKERNAIRQKAYRDRHKKGGKDE